MKFILTLLHPEPWMRLWMPGPTPQDSTWRHNPGLHRGCHVWCGSRGMPVVCIVCPYGHTNVIAVRHVNCKKMYMYLYFTMYFIRNNNVITEPGSINQGAPSVSALPRGPLPSHQGKDLGLLPCRGTKAPWRPWETKQLRLANPGVLWTPRLPSLRNVLQSMVKSHGGRFGVWVPAPGFCPSAPQKKAKFWRVDWIHEKIKCRYTF